MFVQYVVRAALRAPAAPRTAPTAGTAAAIDGAAVAAPSRASSVVLRVGPPTAAETESDADASRSSSSWGRLLVPQHASSSEDGDAAACGIMCLSRLIAVTLADMRRATGDGDEEPQLQWRVIFMRGDVLAVVEHVSQWTSAVRATQIQQFVGAAAATPIACATDPPLPADAASTIVTCMCDDVLPLCGAEVVLRALQLPAASRAVILDQTGACRHRLRPVFQSMWQQPSNQAVAATLPSLSVASLLLQALLTRAHARAGGQRRRSQAGTDDMEGDGEPSSDLGLRRYASLLESRGREEVSTALPRARATRGQGLVSLATAVTTSEPAAQLSEAAVPLPAAAEESDGGVPTPTRSPHKVPGFFSPDTGLLKQLRRRTKQGKDDAAVQALNFDGEGVAPFARAQSYRLELREDLESSRSARSSDDTDSSQGAHLVQELRDAAAVATSPQPTYAVSLAAPAPDAPLSAHSISVFDAYSGMLSREVQDMFALSDSGHLIIQNADPTCSHDDAMHALLSADASVCAWYLTQASQDASTPLCAPVSAAAWTAFLRSAHWLTRALAQPAGERLAASAPDFSLVFVSPRRRAVSRMHAHVVSAARPTSRSSSGAPPPRQEHACAIPWRTWCDSHALPHRAVRVIDRLRRAYVYLSDPTSNAAQPCSAARVHALQNSDVAHDVTPDAVDPMCDPMRFIMNEIPAAHALLSAISIAQGDATPPLPLASVDASHVSVAFASPARVRRGAEQAPTPAVLPDVEASPVAHVRAQLTSSPLTGSSHTPGRRVHVLQSMAAQALEQAQNDAETAERQRSHAFATVVARARNSTHASALWLPCVAPSCLQGDLQPQTCVGARAAAALLCDFLRECILVPLAQLHAGASVPLHTRVRLRTLQVALRLLLLASGGSGFDAAAIEDDLLTLVRATCAYLPDPAAAQGLHFMASRGRDAAPVTVWMAHVCVNPFSRAIPRVCARLFEENDYTLPAALEPYAAPLPAEAAPAAAKRARSETSHAVATAGVKKARMSGGTRAVPTLAPPKLDVRAHAVARSEATLSLHGGGDSSTVSELSAAPAPSRAASTVEASPDDADSRYSLPAPHNRARMRAVAALASTRVGDVDLLASDSMHSVGGSVDEAASRDGFNAAMARRRAHAAQLLAATDASSAVSVDPLTASLRSDRPRNARTAAQDFKEVTQRVQVRVLGGFRRSSRA